MEHDVVVARSASMFWTCIPTRLGLPQLQNYYAKSESERQGGLRLEALQNYPGDASRIKIICEPGGSLGIRSWTQT